MQVCRKKNYKISIQVTEIGYYKRKKKRILLFSVFPDFIFVNMKRNFNYEKILKDTYMYFLSVLKIQVSFSVLKISSYDIVFRLTNSSMLCFEMRSH